MQLNLAVKYGLIGTEMNAIVKIVEFGLLVVGYLGVIVVELVVLAALFKVHVIELGFLVFEFGANTVKASAITV